MSDAERRRYLEKRNNARVKFARKIFDHSQSYLTAQQKKLQQGEKLSLQECQLLSQIIESVAYVLNFTRREALQQFVKNDPAGKGGQSLVVTAGLFVKTIDDFLRAMAKKISFNAGTISTAEVSLVREIRCFSYIDIDWDEVDEEDCLDYDDDLNKEGGYQIESARAAFKHSRRYLTIRQEKLEQGEKLSLQECQLLSQIIESVTYVLDSIRRESLRKFIKDDPDGEGSQSLVLTAGLFLKTIDDFLREMDKKTAFDLGTMSAEEADFVQEIVRSFALPPFVTVPPQT